MLRISVLLLLGQKISTGGLLLALGEGVQTFLQKGEQRVHGRGVGRSVEGWLRGAEDGVSACGRGVGSCTEGWRGLLRAG